MLDAPLIAGPLPTAIAVAGAIGGLVLLARRDRRWWTRTVPISVGVGVLGAVLTAVALAVVPLFPDALPPRVLVWIAIGVAAVAAAVGRLVDRRHVVIALVGALLVVGMCAMKVNAFYGYRTTLAGVLGLPAANEVPFDSVPRTEPPAAVAGWVPPPDMPRTGRIARVDVPGVASGFAARPAWVYLPPAYLASSRPLLPVLVLVPGQPGGPDDWLLAGRLAQVLDQWAAAHAGLAPVVVVPDATGASLANPLCMDSRLGRAETYLTVDVPAWIGSHLQVGPGRAVGGFSFGGTCALQLAVRRPDVYPTFLDVSGQAEPTLGDHARTVAATFGGDEAAFRAVNPLPQLAARRYPGSAGLLLVGADDPVYRPQAEQVAAATRAAGMDVTLSERPGGHTWAQAGEAVTEFLPLLARRTGLPP
ncbi:alpha/beta hydrolase [Pseudonocardia sp. CA-107938]|uniref:alpha/beta hydrolase n=1 Tax=Pseudonocardia sp. CA-107938 TaxID=3240021 RepID=UPI003D940BAF